MMNQIFMPCYFGNEVTLKSARLTHALYSSEWIKMNAPERKEIQMMMIRSMKPIVLKAGGFFYYNVGMFTSTLNTAYSLFCVLQRRVSSTRGEM
ncbi:odorant receptor 94a [Culex quinquefasciatus]|uniref:odorant receptor 94a n=1 Tax=Culex quinquefasciatus TaxID=7176 RepID=UPI0018E2EBD4|nr:odorant receptor 94a [Culex quinquefasciatus]